MTHITSSSAFIELDEADQAFAPGLRLNNVALATAAFEIKIIGTNAGAKRTNYMHLDVGGVQNSIQACVSSDLVFSLVTTDQVETAATGGTSSKGKTDGDE